MATRCGEIGESFICHYRMTEYFTNVMLLLNEHYFVQWIAGEDSANPGSYHAIFHSDVEKSCGGAAGGHGWSSDEGVTWKFSPRNAYGNNVTLVNGTTMTMHQRERPHLVLNQKGQPVALTNGAGWKNDCDAVFTFAQPINTVTLQL